MPHGIGLITILGIKIGQNILELIASLNLKTQMRVQLLIYLYFLSKQEVKEHVGLAIETFTIHHLH